MKKFKALFVLPFLALTSCGDNSLSGIYGFELGNIGGAHFGIYAELSNEDYVDPNQQVAGEEQNKKKFSLTLDVPDGTVGGLTSLLGSLDDEEVDPGDSALTSFDGYYYFGKSTGNGLQVHIGVSIIDEIVEIPDFSKELMEYVMTAYIYEKNFTCHIPVSLEDLQLQLCWYGYYIDFDNPLGSIFVDLFDASSKIQFWPGPDGCGPTGKDNRELRIGTLPTKAQIETMNAIIDQNRGETFSETFKMRTIHIIKLALKKY